MSGNLRGFFGCKDRVTESAMKDWGRYDLEK